MIQLGDQLQAVGVCQSAVDAYIRGNEIKSAIDCCVLLNQWNLAVELAEKHNYQQIENLLSQYARHLLDKRKKLEAVELYRKANRNTDAALLLQEIATDLVKKEADPLTIKKLFVMAAIEVDLFKNRMLSQHITGAVTQNVNQVAVMFKIVCLV